MNKAAALPLALVAPGFADPVLEAQTAFRAALDALARPGRVVTLGRNATPVPELGAAAGALLLSLLSPETRLWLAPALRGGAAEATLRFHTGCVVVDDPAAADFALARAQELPPLETFAAGSDECPERSTTVVVEVPALAPRGRWRLRGPGVGGEMTLAVAGLAEAFLAQWQENGARFPRGVDLFLAAGARLAGLPRTVRVALD